MAAVSITASSFVPSSRAKYKQNGNCISGEALTSGCPVRKNAAGVYVKCQADAADEYEAEGLCVQTVGTGVRFDLLISDPALAIGGTVTKGTAYAVGATAAGTIEPLADIGSGEFMHVIGVAVSSSVLALDCDSVMKTGSTAI